MTAAQRATALRVCAAIYGLGVAISMTPLWVRPAPSGQPPGFMTSLGYDASASLYFVASVIVIPFIASLMWGPLLDRLASDETQRWARNAAAIALLSALWTALQTKNVYWTALAPAVAVLAAFAARRIHADFTRRDLTLLPTIATVFLALLDIASMPFDQIFMIAVFLVMAVRVAIATPLTLTLSPQAGRGHSREDPLPAARGEGGAERRVRGLDPALCFALSPLAVILQTHFFARDQRHFGWPPLLIALLMPIAMRVLAPRRAERFLRVALAITGLQVAVLIGFAVARGIHFHPSGTGVLWFLAVATLFAIGMYGAAETLAARVPSQEEYIGRVPVIAIVPWFLAGSLFPITALPVALTWITKILPLTHTLALMRYGLLGDSTGLHNIWRMNDPAAMAALSLAVVAVFATVLTAVSIRVFARSALR